MLKHKVGDRVKIRKDLVLGNIYGSCIFVKKMQNLAGKVVHITEVRERAECYRIDSNPCYWTDEMFEGVEIIEPKVEKCTVIYTDGNKVVACRGDKKGVAYCRPGEDFDFHTGAKLALKRLENVEKPYRWLKDGTIYYVPDTIDEHLCQHYIYDASDWDKRMVSRGLVFKTKEEAIKCAKRMLEIARRPVNS